MNRLIPFLLLLCGCASNQPGAIMPPVVPSNNDVPMVPAAMAPVQLYLDVTCSNSYLLPDEYTVFVTNSAVAGGYATALEVPAAAFEDVDVPISGSPVFLKAKNQIGQ